MKYVCFYHETYKIAPWHRYFPFIVKFYFAFSLFISAFLIGVSLKKTFIFMKADNQGITGYFQCLPAPERGMRHPTCFIS